MKTDKCKTESEIRTVHRKMIESYTNKMRHIKLRGVYSKQIVRALDYIIGHLYQRIFIKETAEYLKISPALDDSAAKAYCQGLPAAKCYVDNSESYSTNEITIYWNSPFTYLLSLTENNGTPIDPIEPVAGDVNADGVFNISDVVALQKWLLAVPDVELADWKTGDLYQDDVLNVIDLCFMKQKLING